MAAFAQAIMEEAKFQKALMVRGFSSSTCHVVCHTGVRGHGSPAVSAGEGSDGVAGVFLIRYFANPL